MQDSEIERIAIDLRRQREILERDMDDTDRNIDVAGLLERIESLKRRIEATRAAFGNNAAPETTS